MAGVHFGETRGAVLERLGPPTRMTIASGTRSWYTLWYLDGPYAGLEVHFIENLGEDFNASPADYYVMDYPFRGTTAEGIGIGSKKTQLFTVYGQPLNAVAGARVRADGTTYETTVYQYCLGRRQIQYRVTTDTVAAMYYGYHGEPLMAIPCA
ncbi:MAG: hypothetical protein RhofKO_05980 [Rhodothermales bacterium]